MIRRLLIACIALALTFAAIEVRGNDAKAAAKKMEGTWAVETATTSGKKVQLQGAEITFDNDTMTIKAGNEHKFEFKLDPSQKPATIELRLAGEVPRIAFPRKGIYELNGDTLKLCFGTSEKPPTELSDRDAILAVLKRKK